jgi:PAP2 superfamily protein
LEPAVRGYEASLSGRSNTRRGFRSLIDRRLPLFGEVAFLGLVIAAWQLIRVPLQGSLPTALDHARDWLALERVAGVDFEDSLIRLAHSADAVAVLEWGYDNLHLPVLFGFMALVRQLDPARYPLLRSAFVLSHVPAALLIGLYPLAPPKWVAGMPFAVEAPPDLNGPMHNATAAVASQHVGYPLFIAACAVWLVPRRRLAWLVAAYPLLVFAIVVGTSNHYTLDAVVGGLCIALGFVAARLLHGPVPPRTAADTTLASAMLAAAGYACIVRVLVSTGDLSLPPAPLTSADVVLLAGIGLVLAGRRRVPSREPSLEGSGA